MLSRRFALTSATAATFVGAPWIRRAEAATITYKFGSDLPASHPLNLRMREAATLIEQDTNGQMRIELFPDNQLGSDPDMFAQLRAGALEFFTVSGANALSSLVPGAAISAVGFAFSSADQAFAAMDGALGASIRQQINKAGIIVLDKAWNNGFRETTTRTRPIYLPSDLKGLKIRVPPGRQYVDLFKALGAAPTAMSFNEVYSALQTGAIDGQENPLAVISLAKLYEVQRYCSLTRHIWDGFWFLCNQAAWRRLPGSVQEIVAKHVNAKALEERQDVVQLNASLEKFLEKNGMKMISVDPNNFREALRQTNYYANQKAFFGEEAWTNLEAISGKLA